jgi:hypothetical protein
VPQGGEGVGPQRKVQSLLDPEEKHVNVCLSLQDASQDWIFDGFFSRRAMLHLF